MLINIIKTSFLICLFLNVNLYAAARAATPPPQKARYAKIGLDSRGVASIAPKDHHRVIRAAMTAAREQSSSDDEWLASKHDFMRSGAAEFSGALQWAHKQGLTGRGITIGVLEVDGAPRLVRQDSATKTTDLSGIEAEHAVTIVDIIRQMAPKSPILVDVRTSIPDAERLRPAFIINDSSALSKPETESECEQYKEGCEYYLSTILVTLTSSRKQWKDIDSRKKLLVTAAGNQHLPLSNEIKIGRATTHLDKWYLAHNAMVNDHLIIVGNIQPSFYLDPLSNTPGDDPLLQSCFIWTLGTDVLFAHERVIKENSGTSMAAPIVSGVAALLKQKYPLFTVQDIREVILESADRSFFALIKNPHMGDRYVYFYDLHETPPHKLPRSSLDIEFNPSQFGKGILNVRNAFVYGDLKLAHPKWDAHHLRRAMLEKLEAQENKAATYLQKKWRRYKAKSVSDASPPHSPHH